MKVYILQEITGIYYGCFDVYNSIAFLSKETAEKYLNNLNKFIEPIKYNFEYNHPLVRSCCYELYKLGYINNWNNIDIDEIPIFKIQEVEVYRNNDLI